MEVGAGVGLEPEVAKDSVAEIGGFSGLFPSFINDEQIIGIVGGKYY